MTQEIISKNIRGISWKVILAVVSLLIIGVFAFVLLTGYTTKQKLMNGRWKLVSMEADDAFSKRVFNISQQSSDADFIVNNVGEVTLVTFFPDTLTYGCKVKAKAIEFIDGQQIFQIVELTEDRLELEQMVFNHGGPFGPYKTSGHGKRLRFINLNTHSVAMLVTFYIALTAQMLQSYQLSA